MNDPARQLLLRLLRDHGIRVADDPRRLEALLRDYGRGQYKRETHLCVLAAREGVVKALENRGPSPLEAVVNRLSKQLHEDCALELSAARWTVECWVVALGLPVPAQDSNPVPSSAAQPRPSSAAPQPVSVKKTAAASGIKPGPLAWTPRYFRDRLKSGGVGPEMAEIPAGTFVMGSPANEPERSFYEGPQHTVTFAKPFALGRYAVTFEEYDGYCAEASLGRNLIGRTIRPDKPSDEGWGRGARPVINVSWRNAEAYCDWLSQQTGKLYRLPTEAEREYACRAGTVGPFYFGNTISPKQANYGGRYAYNGGPMGEYRGKTLPVGQFPPNAFGLYDMHGNVSEWCEDLWHEDYTGAPNDGSAWTSGGHSSRRVLRGGSWDDGAGWVRSAGHYGFAPGTRLNALGFRLSRM